MLCRAIGISDASIRSQSLSSLVPKASLRREPADRMRPMMVLDCPMKAFTNRFSGVSPAGLIFRSDTTSGRLPPRRLASHAADGESDDGSTAVPVLVTRSRGVCASTLVMASIRTSRRWLRHRRCGSLRIRFRAGRRRTSSGAPVGQDVAQVHESVVEDLVAGRRADRVAPGSGLPGREWEGGGRLGQLSEHGVELVIAELPRDQFHGSEVREFEGADRVDEGEYEGAVTCPCPSGFRQLVRYPCEVLMGPVDDPRVFALQSVATHGARGRFAGAKEAHGDAGRRSCPIGTVQSPVTQ